MTTSLVRTRYGAEADLASVIALHHRCSTEALNRRFHAPMPRVRERLARQLVCPVGGWSMLAELGGEVVGMAVAGPLSCHDIEIALLVENSHQGCGIGTRLLRQTAADAAQRGYRAVQCLTQPDNQAVLGVVRKAGLVALPTWNDGLLHIEMPLTRAELPQPA
jgi:ribosomal protein S18 acetylase RimI-like enzyme